MIAITNLSYYIGDRALYDSASLHIKPKDKIGLIGLNGTGKSTLLKIIVGEIKATGTIRKNKECTIGFLNQDLLSYQSDDSIRAVAMLAFEDVVGIQRQIDKVLVQMESNYEDSLVDKLAKLQDTFMQKGGYELQSKADAVLEGMGFPTKDLERPLCEFSGGWRMRVMLSKLLLQKPSLLILDEPTNHLDLTSIQWVENYLKNYEKGLIVVSHDRTFLNQISNKTIEIANKKFNSYAGNYSFYEEEKSLRTSVQQNAYENQQKQIKDTEKFIERFRSKATKAKQVQSRIKALDRIDMVEQVTDTKARVRFSFPIKQQPGRTVAFLENISKSFGQLELLKNANITVERGDKIALIGSNGKGKSTLLRIIANNDDSCYTSKKLGHNVIMSFYAQHQLEALNLENTVMEELSQMDTERSETDIRRIAGMFLFTKDEVFKKIGVLSGGEKSRVALAKVLLSNANFLLLDEPTNHLDIISIEALAQALQQYEGTFIIVSHDRHFIAKVATKIWFIEDKQIKEYPGTYEEYTYSLSQS